MITLYDYLPSGNCYKVRLVLTQLGIPFERVHVQLRMDDAAREKLRQLCGIGRVPVAVLDSGEPLAESNAMLWYFAEGTPLIPTDKLERARMLQWMFFEQYDHEPFIAVPRAWLKFFGIPAGKEAELVERQKKGYAALDVMEKHLAKHEFFPGTHYSLADIALFAYTHVCDEGGHDLSRYPAIRAWIQRVQSQPKHIPITQA